jgi:predicted nucleic acid-binding protein
LIVVDSNFLLTAFRAEFLNPDRCRKWLEVNLMADRLCIPNVVQISFFRLATRALGTFSAAPVESAQAFLESLAPFNDELPLDLTQHALKLCQHFMLRGNGTVDAWIAAHAIALGGSLATLDDGFSRYSQITLVSFDSSPAYMP